MFPNAAIHVLRHSCSAEIKAANHKHRNDQLNRALQNMMFATLGEANEMASKKALGLLTELWRRQIWRDARTANVIGKPCKVQQS